MRFEDFRTYEIADFTPDEIINTGAALRGVSVTNICKIQKFRSILKRRVGLLKNGLTTGIHRSLLHPDGHAVDFFLYESDGAIDINEVVYALLESGFTGICVYFNGVTYSFHADERPGKMWLGVSTIDESGKHAYYGMISDPKKVLENR